MKQLKIENHFLYFREQIPSKSFLKKLSSALTAQISCAIKSAVLKSIFTDIVELAFNKDGIQYDILRPFELFMRIEAKNSPLVISNITVIWNLKSHDKETSIYPWSDVSQIDIDFEMKIADNDLKKLNYLLPFLYTPVITSIDSGLPYDYQIKCQTTDGKLSFYFNESFEYKNIQELEFTLKEFVEHYNWNNKTKIHYMGNVKISKSNRICVAMDFGSCTIEVIKECIYAFKKLSFIKKIIYN